MSIVRFYWFGSSVGLLLFARSDTRFSIMEAGKLPMKIDRAAQTIYDTIKKVVVILFKTDPMNPCRQERGAT